MASLAPLLSRPESILFLKERLKIVDVEIKLKTNPKTLLDMIVCLFLQRFPLQTITLHLVPPEERLRPSWMAVKSNILDGMGGMCYELNVFMFALLKGLGYHVSLVDANVKLPSNHVMTIVRNVSNSGDLHLIDAGCGFPTFQAVDLTFERESPIYQQSFLNYKFVKKNGRIFRMHIPRMSVANDVQKENDSVEWKRYYDFELAPLTLEQINERFDRVFEVPSSTSSHRVLRCTLFPGQRACALRNNVILKENEFHVLEETEYNSDHDLKVAICDTFEMFADKTELVEQSIKGWRKINDNAV